MLGFHDRLAEHPLGHGFEVALRTFVFVDGLALDEHILDGVPCVLEHRMFAVLLKFHLP